MEKLNKITRIKFSILLLYFLTLFLPIYSQIMFGTKFKISIAQLNAGTFFVIVILLLIIATFVSLILYEQYHKYVYFTTIGFMVLLGLILLLFKESEASIRFTWFFQLLLISILIASYVKEDMIIRIFDMVTSETKKYIKKFLDYIKSKKNRSTDQKEEEV